MLVRFRRSIQITPWCTIALIGLLFCVIMVAGYRTGTVQAETCLPNVRLLDDHGQSFSLESLQGKAVLVDFIHASCPGICLNLTDKLSAVAKDLGPEMGSKAALLSVTNDPEHDSPAQLLKMAKGRKADLKGWLFATGTPDNITLVMRDFGLKREKDPDGGPAHIEGVFLLDSNGCRVREYQGIVMNPDKVAMDMKQAISANR